jgi:hypothetical protein
LYVSKTSKNTKQIVKGKLYTLFLSSPDVDGAVEGYIYLFGGRLAREGDGKIILVDREGGGKL